MTYEAICTVRGLAYIGKTTRKFCRTIDKHVSDIIHNVDTPLSLNIMWRSDLYKIYRHCVSEIIRRRKDWDRRLVQEKMQYMFGTHEFEQAAELQFSLQ